MSALKILCLAVVLSLIPRAASASENLFPETKQAAAAHFYKMGEHRTIYKFFFKLYDAALYTEHGATADDVLTRACAFHLEFRYLRTIPRATILESADHMLAKNLSDQTLARLDTPIKQLHATYRSVEAGDTSSLSYTPDIGTTFAINGSPLITIPGKEFAHAYLSIWLGSQPISVELRDRLLAQ